MSRSTAIVIGYGLAGACCARILSRVCDRVIVVERDELPTGLTSRPGVPQARHAHLILDRGRRELEYFFPGFEAQLVQQGGIVIDPGLEFASFGRTGWAPRVQTSMRAICASRDLTDATVRSLAALPPNVELRTNSEVTALRLAGQRIVGVELRARDAAGPESIDATVVVDASGRSSKLPALLQAASVAPPEETVIDSGTWYSSRWFERTQKDSRDWWRAAILLPTPNGPGALLMPVEGNRWVVSIATVGRGQPDIDEGNYEAALRALPSPIIAEAVGAPLSTVYGSRSTPNRLRHFERWATPIAGLLPVGDAVCALNPVHGQGVSHAMVCARVLEATIAEVGVDSPLLATRFLKAQARWFAELWGGATSFDLSFPTTPGKRPLGPKLFAPYLRMFAEAVREDRELLRQVGEVGQLNQPMATLMAPRVVAKVLGSAVRRRLAGVQPSASRRAMYPPLE